MHVQEYTQIHTQTLYMISYLEGAQQQSQKVNIQGKKKKGRDL